MGGQTVAEAFPEADLDAIRESTLGFASRFGVTAMAFPDRIPNTRRTLAAAEFARQQGKLTEFWHAAMDAHWVDGRDIEASDTLAAMARRARLEPDAVVAAADDPAYLGRVDALRLEATEAHVTSIPTFIVGGQRIVGCQPYERLAAMVKQAADGSV